MCKSYHNFDGVRVPVRVGTCVFDSVRACVDSFKEMFGRARHHDSVPVYDRVLFCVCERLTHTRQHISSCARW